MEVVWRLMDKVPDHLKLPSKLFKLKQTPDGIVLWRKVWYDMKREAEEAQELKDQIEDMQNNT